MDGMENAIDIKKLVEEMFTAGKEVEEIVGLLKQMLDEQKISEEEYQKGVELAQQTEKQLASKQFGVDIL